jgi:phosphoribosylformimino-5-aminoimidazole carboxamide ribotide isomerase
MSTDARRATPPGRLTAERVNRLNDDDLSALCEATTAAILDGGGFGWLHPPPRQELERYLRGLLLVPERSLFVARLDGAIVGAAQIARPPRSNEAQAMTAQLTGFYVAPYARRRGAARVLAEAVLRSARHLGCKVLNCDVRETQTAALSLFRSLGFEHWGTHPYYARAEGRTVRGLFLTLPLGDTPAKTTASPSTAVRPEPVEPDRQPMTASLTLYPAIDLKDGACVRLRRGEMEDATRYSDDPGAQARAFVDAGCERLHVVDLNGAFAGRSTNASAIEAILANARVPVQLGGGIRNMAAIERWLTAGVDRVILGSVAVKDPDLVRQAARAFPGRIVAGIDARQGRVATEGWAEISELDATDLARRMEDAGVAAIIFTEITRDGMLEGLDIPQTAALARAVSIPVIASGGVGELSHLQALRDAAKDAPGISGVIVGRALYDGRVSLADALRVLR